METPEQTDLLTVYAQYVVDHVDPDVCAFLQAHPEASIPERAEVLRFDYDWRLAQGRPFRLADYYTTHPDLAETVFGSRTALLEVSRPDHTAGRTASFRDVDRGPGADVGERSGADRDRTRFSVDPRMLSSTDPGTLSGKADGASWGERVRLIEGSERFLVRRLLGAGGMGMVYEVLDRKRSEIVALKIMRRIDPAAFYQFKCEFRSLADLSHPNLLNLYELVSMGDRLAFTMELVEGKDFLAYVREGNQAPNRVPPGGDTSARRIEGAPRPMRDVFEPEAGPTIEPDQEARLRAALAQLVAGISVLHQAGILHRDIKPSNVLVTRSGRVVLLDFGLAIESVASGSLPDRGWSIVGTVPYMAPEQAAGRPVSPSSDWYSVGVMLHEALVGRRPIEGTATEILGRKQTISVPPPSSFAPGIPADLDSLCHRLLAIEPSDRPTGSEMLGDLQGVAVSSLPGSCWSPSRIPLIGRTWHRQRLEAALERVVREHRPVFVGLHGRSGIGKTALVQAFLDQLIERDAAVILSGRCYERESVPYKALDSLVDALARDLGRRPTAQVAAMLPRHVHALARIFPVLRRVEAIAAAPVRSTEPLDPQELRRRAFGALRVLMQRLTTERPLVLAIDDLQWGDVDSAALLCELLRPPDAPAILVVGSYRSEDRGASPFLEKLSELRSTGIAEEDFFELEVVALTEVEACELVRTLVGPGETDELIRDLAREAGGNPFFIQELVQHALQGERAPETRSLSSIDLDEVLWARVNRLPEHPRRLLELISVSGHPLHQADALASIDLRGEGRVALMTLRTSRLIRFRGQEEAEEVEPYHDRIRETVLKHLPHRPTADYHGHLARTLESSGRAGPDLLASHFLGSGDKARAAHYYGRAADQALEALAFDHAASLYRLALELDPPQGEPERRLRTRLADALANAGRCVEAAQQYQRASIDAAPDESLVLRRQATLHFLTSGHLAEGFASLRDVLDRVKLRFPKTSRRVFASLLWNRLRLRMRGLRHRLRAEEDIPRTELARIDVAWSAGAGLAVIDTVRAAEFQVRGVLLALQAGEPMRLVRNLAVEAAFEATTAGVARQSVEALLREAEALARHLDHPYAHGIVALGTGLASYSIGEWKRCLDLVDRAEALFRDRCTSVTWELDNAHVFALWSLKYLGELAELQRRWPILVSEARDRGDRFAVTHLSSYLLAMVYLAADEAHRATEELTRFEQVWDYPGFHLQHHGILQGQVYAALYQGEPGRAWELMRSHWPRYCTSMLIRLQKIKTDALFLRANSAAAAAASNHPDAARLRRDAAWCADRLDHVKLPWPRALATLIRASLDAIEGRPAIAASGFSRAAEQFEACDMKLASAVARLRWAEIVQGDEGREAKNQATGLFLQEKVKRPDRLSLLYAPPISPGTRS